MQTARIVFTVVMALILMGCPPPISDNPDAPSSEVNDSAQNGDNPVPVRKHQVASVSSGGAQSMILKTDDSLWAVGANGSGQLGNNGADNLATRLNPVQITPVAGCHDYLPGL